MKLLRTPQFDKDLRRLSPQDRQRALRKLEQFRENPDHPSFRKKKMLGWNDIWEAHISERCVFTFQWGEPVDDEPVVLLRRIGRHDVYKSP